jgi:hypothetical protein
MNGRRAIVGLCMFCALLVSAFAAEGASAAGTTAYTCKAGTGVGKTFNTVHCRPGDPAGGFGHFSIANNTKTETTANNKDHTGALIPWTLVSTTFGATVEFKMEGVSSSGTIENSEENGEMLASGSGTITFTNVTVVKPANCFVQTDGPAKEKLEVGVIHTEPLKTTTTGQGDRLKFEPVTAPNIARFWIEGPSCPLKGTTKTVTGSVTGQPNGATTEFTEADTTTQASLFLNGNKAGLTGSLTIEGRANSSDTYKPLSVTT